MKGLISAETRLRDLFRIRPRSLELLGSLEIGAFSDPRQTLNELFRRSAPEAVTKFLEALEQLPFPNESTAWDKASIPHLLDFLTHQHRVFQLDHLNDIHFILDLLAAGSPSGPSEWRALQNDFSAFAKDAKSSMDDEEKILYPRILRYDACVRLPKVHPEFHQGSLQGLVANHRTRMRSRLDRKIRDLGVQLQNLNGDEGDFDSKKDLQKRWAIFHQEWIRHDALETRTLYPRAAGLERTLYNLSIEGGSMTAHQVPGPFDSGLVRLRAV